MTALADYRTLTKADFLASSVGGFGFWRKQKIRLTRRAIKRIFWMGFSGPKYFDLAAVTSSADAKRAAVVVNITYYSVLGRKLSEQKQFLFADPAADLKAQRIWLRPKSPATFARVELSRAGVDPCVGLAGHLKLSRQGELQLHPSEVAKSRDRAALEHTLALALEDSDRTFGRVLLARLIYLWQDAAHVRDLQMLADADRLIAEGMRCRSEEKRNDLSGKETFLYDALCSEFFPESVPLSKSFRLEIVLLSAAVRAANAKTIVMGSGSNSEARAIAASIVADNLSLRLQSPDGVGSNRVGWLSAAELKKLHV